ncbi:tRNA (guanosine(46)-N7)-methyltransferase TrmB [Tepidibacillus fermentans]|uniref:tRNA (guanine-N(7)-)-methyltransferase n=1 Tax=Tepidibacillus fermentans TaxID=1281767 RepID=A0A4R3KGK8_9BACI|nr:tRNA (guanosine(46)-N7)-methyltransferase TrmB [Tepidibacillus fermentans]TCS82556.1 tRNA (guanine-N(7)-)-methyltransferase [Tepidibacillus fermentans]
MRLRKKPWVKDEIFQYTSYSVKEPREWKGKWRTLFGNDYPIHVEFGTGRGNFITTLAKQNPEINYIALEQKQEVLVQAVRKAVALELKNIRFILGNANFVLDFFSDDEIARIYLNFVDPWPKNRHAKRRLTHQNYLNMYQQILQKNGSIHLKTDNEILFEFSLNELSLHPFYQLHDISLNLYRNEENLEKHVQTEYELKFLEQGKPIYRLEATLI